MSEDLIQMASGLVTREEARDKIAEAIYQVQVDRALRDLQGFDFRFSDVTRVLEASDAESDRSAAIMVFALAEDLMLRGFKHHLNPIAWGNGKDIAGANGVLGTASNRLKLLHLLSWISDRTAKDLRTLKEIRNHFAHHPDVSGFDDQKIAGLIGQLTDFETPVVKMPEHAGRSVPHREKFLSRAGCTVICLTTELAVGPAARAHHVRPNDLHGKDFASAPPAIQESRLMMADIILRSVNRCVPPPLPPGKPGKDRERNRGDLNAKVSRGGRLARNALR